MGWLAARLSERLTSRLVVMALVITTITVGLLPAWNVHLVPESVRKVFFFRHYSGGGFRTEYELWSMGAENLPLWKEIALTLKQHFEPEDSVVYGGIGTLGYYSGLHICDRFGLVDRRVAMREPELLRYPGHDIKVSVGFFLSHEPTILRLGRVDGPPPDRENPEYPLARRIRLTAESWRQWGPGPIWRRYAPEILPLKPSPDGSRNALLILRLIEEAPHISTLPRPERVATRKKRAKKAWGDFFAALDSASIERNN